MSKMRVVQVPRPNGPFELVERDIPAPADSSVRIQGGYPPSLRIPVDAPGDQRLEVRVRVVIVRPH
jgi:hypothetical protein